MKVLIAHPGTQHSFQLAKQLYKRGMLYELHSCLVYGKDSFVYKILSKLPRRIFKKISNRFIDEVPDHFIRRRIFIEFNAIIRTRLGQDEEEVMYRRNKKFQQTISDGTLRAADAVIGFDTSSWIIAERCKKVCRNFFLDASIAHPVSKDVVYRNIIKLYPDWEFAIKLKSQKHIAVEKAEMELATHIVVASSFTLNTYVEQGVPREKISINPYGVDTELLQPRSKIKSPGDKFRFVFVGLVDARKGIPFLLEIWNKINHVNGELTLIGPVTRHIEAFVQQHFPTVVIKGKVSFRELINSLPDYDAMIFPSFFEGFGLVIPEAMACGVPVITTTATCGPDIIEPGKEGFIISPGDKAGLEEAIRFMLQNPEKAAAMGVNARKKVEQFVWTAYGEHWARILYQQEKIDVVQLEKSQGSLSVF